MKCSVKDFCETVQARIVIFGMQVDDSMLYRRIADQASAAYYFLYLSYFLSFDTSKHGISLLLLILPFICQIFFLSIL